MAPGNSSDIFYSAGSPTSSHSSQGSREASPLLTGMPAPGARRATGLGNSGRLPSLAASTPMTAYEAPSHTPSPNVPHINAQVTANLTTFVNPNTQVGQSIARAEAATRAGASSVFSGLDPFNSPAGGRGSLQLGPTNVSRPAPPLLARRAMEPQVELGLPPRSARQGSRGRGLGRGRGFNGLSRVDGLSLPGDVDDSPEWEWAAAEQTAAPAGATRQSPTPSAPPSASQPGASSRPDSTRSSNSYVSVGCQTEAPAPQPSRASSQELPHGQPTEWYVASPMVIVPAPLLLRRSFTVPGGPPAPGDGDMPPPPPPHRIFTAPAQSHANTPPPPSQDGIYQPSPFHPSALPLPLFGVPSFPPPPGRRNSLPREPPSPPSSPADPAQGAPIPPPHRPASPSSDPLHSHRRRAALYIQQQHQWDVESWQREHQVAMQQQFHWQQRRQQQQQEALLLQQRQLQVQQQQILHLQQHQALLDRYGFNPAAHAPAPLGNFTSGPTQGPAQVDPIFPAREQQIPGGGSVYYQPNGDTIRPAPMEDPFSTWEGGSGNAHITPATGELSFPPPPGPDFGWRDMWQAQRELRRDTSSPTRGANDEAGGAERMMGMPREQEMAGAGNWMDAFRGRVDDEYRRPAPPPSVPAASVPAASVPAASVPAASQEGTVYGGSTLVAESSVGEEVPLHFEGEAESEEPEGEEDVMYIR